MIKLYAIRDRLIDYYMQPFAAPGDKEVLAAVARNVNSGDQSDIQQAPHHFEVWQLGYVTEEGNLVAERQLIADCSSLIRGGIRTNRDARSDQATNTPGDKQESPGGPGGGTSANLGPVPIEAPPTPGKAEALLRGHPGGYNPRMRDTHEGHLTGSNG